MNCIILAKGEKSKRMGKEKPFLIFQGKSLIEIVFEKIRELFGMIYIVSTIPEKFFKFENVNVKVVKDKIKCGPLGGIYTGLINSDTYYNFVLGIDLIFASKELIIYMIEKEKEYDVLLPRAGKYIQPLFGIYSKNTVKVIKKRIEREELKVMGIFNELNVKFLEENELRKFGKPEILFFNLNTKQDIKKAEYIWGKFF